MTMMTPEFAEEDRRLLSSLIKRGFNPTCIYDIGGSDGAWTRAVQDLFPFATFEIFEPLSDHEVSYKDKMMHTIASDSRFHLNKVAVGATPGFCDIHMFPNAVGSTTLELKYELPGVHIVNVERVQIDDLVRNRGMQIPQLIKIDIQGGEMEALKGAAQTLPYVDALLLETWLTRGYGDVTPLLGELTEFLRKYGFFLDDFGDEYRTPDGILASKDCLFVNIASPISSLYTVPTPKARREILPSNPVVTDPAPLNEQLSTESAMPVSSDEEPVVNEPVPAGGKSQQSRNKKGPETQSQRKRPNERTTRS